LAPAREQTGGDVGSPTFPCLSDNTKPCPQASEKNAAKSFSEMIRQVTRQRPDDSLTVAVRRSS
jgi:hypothetical protein